MGTVWGVLKVLAEAAALIIPLIVGANWRPGDSLPGNRKPADPDVRALRAENRILRGDAKRDRPARRKDIVDAITDRDEAGFPTRVDPSRR